MTDKLQFRRVTGEQADVEVRVDVAEFPAGEFLVARRAWLGDGTELRQHRVARGTQRGRGYDRLDNEILAGRRLAGAADWGYPPEVARLYGDEAASADPYALFEPYRGEPLRRVGTHLVPEEQETFEVSLLNGLCWMAAAGIAHRGLSPDTVLWDSGRGRVLITDFSLSTVFGAPREAVPGSQEWVAREQRPGSAAGRVSERDDIWAAGRLIFFVRNHGEDLAARGQLADRGLEDLLEGVFGPPEGRPTARELLVNRLGRSSPVPRGASGGGAWLRDGHQRFWDARNRKHPGAAIPPEAAGEAGGPRGPAGADPPAPPGTGPVRPAPASTAPAGTGAGDSAVRDDGTARYRQFRRRRGGR